ncbi:MAG: 6-phosphofructokinase [Tissierellia bacterium]|nr:6-phosphofructokinase [Tissierellia bacterium]
MKKIGILSSGGDAPGMNAAIRSIVRSTIYNGGEIYGIYDGYKGLMEGAIEEMNVSSVADIIHRGGTILRTSRSKEFMTEDGLKRAVNVAKVYDLDGIIVIGGDGSGRGALSLAKEGIKTFLIPSTIDNDLGYTDYTVGFMTAVENVVDAISKIRDTSGSHGRANVIEVMGRRCGDLAIYSGLAGGAESIIIPEMPYDLAQISKTVLRGVRRGKKHHIIVLSEGVGNAYDIAKEVQENTGVDTKVSVLGYIQRGGTPSSFDRILAANLGARAVELVFSGRGNMAIGTKDGAIMEMDLEEALNTKKDLDGEVYNLVERLSI